MTRHMVLPSLSRADREDRTKPRVRSGITHNGAGAPVLKPPQTGTSPRPHIPQEGSPMTLIAHADVHELPADTQLVHVASTACICGPVLDRTCGDVWIHRPLDSPHPVLSPLAGTEW